MMERNVKIEKKCLILVEGQTELKIFEKLTEQLSEFVQIICCDGVGNYKKILEIVSDFQVVKRLCIVRDAENDESVAFEEIKKSVENTRFPCPTELEKWSETEELKTAVFILPGGGKPGSLETLILDEVKELQKSADCRENYFDCMKEAGEIKFDEKNAANMSKFHVHAWCLAQKDVDGRVGSCFRDGLFSLPTLEKIVKFVVEGLN